MSRKKTVYIGTVLLNVNFVSKRVNFVSYLVAAPQLCYSK